MSRNLLVALALAVVSLAVAAPAHAVLITVNFVDFSNVVGSGSFAFDSSIIPIGGGTVGATGGTTDYASSINLTDHFGQVWNAGNSGVNYLNFDSSGNLTEWILGGDVNGINVIVFGDPDFRFYVLGGTSYAQVNDGSGSNSVGPADIAVTWSFSPQPPYGGAAPEPGTLAMFAPGLLALGLVRRRKS